MRLTYSRMFNSIEENSKIHDETINKLFFLPPNIDTKFEKKQTKARRQVQH